MSTLTITEFLEARLSEDELTARLSLTDGADLSIVTFNEDERDATNVLVIGKDRVLAECAAKGIIIGVYRAMAANRPKDGSIGWYQVECYMTVIRTLAAVYKDHADYRQEWAL